MFLSCPGEIGVETATENRMNFVPWCFFLSVCFREAELEYEDRMSWDCG